jgi:hypothetical protein
MTRTGATALEVTPRDLLVGKSDRPDLDRLPATGAKASPDVGLVLGIGSGAIEDGDAEVAPPAEAEPL